MDEQRSVTRSASRRRRKRRRIKLLPIVLLVGLAAAGFGGWKLLHERGESPSGKPANTATPAVSVPKASATATPQKSVAPSPSASASASPTPTATPSSTPAVGSATPAGAQVKMAFVGDVIMASTVETLLQKNGYDYPYKDVLPLLQSPDLTIANLETPITKRGTAQSKEYVYKSPPEALPAFVDAGFDIVNLANNHSIDMGTEGLLDTFDALDKAGIKRIGAGRDAKEAFSPVIVEKNGIRIAFLGFSRVVPEQSWKAGINHPGVADTYSYVPAVAAIEAARKDADLVVVSAHWGVERNSKPEPYQTDLAHRFIDAGADLVIGHHPHVLQGFESYKGKWIAYSLGNFIFTTNEVKDTLETVVLQASCTKERSCSLNAVPIFTQWAKPVVMNEADGKKLFNRLSGISFGAAVDEQGRVATKAKATSPSPKSSPK
ncbi:CapA family protein [Paenibacillus cymbidii]|uniref:CapA family protein n=1 Tax=Paenibacillus cymbidii TaxID=1639034 RepID=UPI0010805F69|nr:CapA family protein [Paenibacillus cymbidii]